MRSPRYGWLVVAAAFTLMFTGFGAAYSFAAFFRAFQDEFAASRGHVAAVFSVAAFLWFALGAPGGMLADRFGTRRVAVAGVACLGAGLIAAGHAPSLAWLYVTFSVGLGVGIGLTYVPSVGAVQPWFTHNRAFASGIAVAGIGAGNFLVPPLATWWIDLFGWRGAFFALAALCIVLGGAAAAVVDNRPEGPRRAAAAPPAGSTLGAALGSRLFWALYLTLLLPMFGCFVPMVHLAPYAVDAGHPEAVGVLLVSLIGLGSLVGRFAIGAFADRIGRIAALAWMFGGLGAMLVLWWASTSIWALGAMAIAFGMFYGGFVATLPAVVMDLFGGRAVAGIIGWLYTAAGVGTLAGPPLAGIAYDAFGSYDAPILAGAALSFAGAAGAYALRGARPLPA
jgi:MFS family permease